MKRAEIISKKAAISNTIDSMDKRKLHEEIEKLAKELEKTETNLAKFCQVDGQDFFDDLKDKVAQTPSKSVGQGKIRVLQSVFQADTTIAKASIQNRCDLAFMNDSDLAALAGKSCIGISEFKLVKSAKKGVFTIDKACIFSASKELITKICKEAIHFQAQVRTKTAGEKQKDPYIINAVIPLFDSVDDPRTRALYAVAAGCDVFPGGVFGVAATRIMATIKQKCGANGGTVEYDEMFRYLAEVHRKNKIPTASLEAVEGMLSAYIDAFLFEPANTKVDNDDDEKDDDEIEDDDDGYNNNNNNTNHYMFAAPKRLPKFIKAFATSTVTLFDGPTTKVCRGVGCGEHEFLEIDGFFSCSVCNDDAVYCRFCILVKPGDNIIGTNNDSEAEQGDCCFRCYSEFMIGPTDDNAGTTVFKTKDEMKAVLVLAGVDISNDMHFDEIEDLYDAMIDTPGGLVYNGAIREQIPYPLREASFIDRIGKLTSVFQFRDGASFLQDPNLSKRHVIHLTHLLSLLVTYSPTNSKARMVATVLPEIIKNSAAQSRLHSGFRLLKRAIRHGMDPRTPPLTTANGNIVEYNGEIGILMCHSVRASMKQEIYPTRHIFTAKGVVCCECECKVGGQKRERIMCVHILPSQLMLSLLLHNGLAQHALYALATLWKCADNNETAATTPISNEDTIMMVAAIRNLEICASSTSLFNNIKCGPLTSVTENSQTINECLAKYSVGTDNLKFSPPPPRDPNKVGPLKDMIKGSPVAQLAAIIDKKKKVEVTSPNSQSRADETLPPPPDYNRISRTLRALDKHIPPKKKASPRTNFVGFSLMELRQTCSDCESSNIESLLLRNAIDAANGVTQDNPSKNTAHMFNLTNQMTSKHTIKSTTARPIRHKCAMGCIVNEDSYPFHNIPPPQIIPSSTSTDAKRKAIAIGMQHREIYFKRCGLERVNENKRLRLCSRHPREEEDFNINWYNSAGKMQKIIVPLDVPLWMEEDRRITLGVATTGKRPLQEKFETQKNRRILESENIQSKEVPSSYRRYCSFAGCCSTNLPKDNGISFHRVPAIPKFQKCSDRYRPYYYAKLYHRREVLRRMSLSPDDSSTDLRICSMHGTENNRQNIQWETESGEKRFTYFDMIVPNPAGEKSPLKKRKNESKGIGETRIALKHLNDANKILKQPHHKDFDYVGQGVYHHTMEENQNEKIRESQKDNSENVPPPIDPYLAAALGITKNKNEKLHGKSYFGTPIKVIKVSLKEIKRKHGGTCVQPQSLQDWQVKVRTGFPSLHILMAYIIVCTDGNVVKMTETISGLSWFEEWFVYFEWEWGRTATTWDALRLLYDNRHKQILGNIYDSKVALVKKFREKCPAFATLDEDEALKGEQWMHFYQGKRPIMWDMMDLSIPKPADAEMQSHTHSLYYGGNVTKGGIGLQQCGWIRVADLWQGAVTDTDYIIRAKILEKQSEFIKIHDQRREEVKFINILDKGFRITRAAWETGNQTVLQPHFAKADAKFTGTQTLYSASVASDRGGNERAVRLSKKAGFLRRGLQQNANVDRFCDSWLTWGFQVNFMFEPVL